MCTRAAVRSTAPPVGICGVLARTGSACISAFIGYAENTLANGPEYATPAMKAMNMWANHPPACVCTSVRTSLLLLLSPPLLFCALALPLCLRPRPDQPSPTRPCAQHLARPSRSMRANPRRKVRHLLAAIIALICPPQRHAKGRLGWKRGKPLGLTPPIHSRVPQHFLRGATLQACSPP